MGRDVLVWLGLKGARLTETKKNQSICATLDKISGIVDSRKPDFIGVEELPSPYGNLLYTIASKLKPQINHNLELLVEYVVNDNLKSEAQLTAAMDYLMKHAGDSLNEQELKAASGVGVVVSVEEIDAAVRESIANYKEELIQDRYLFNANKILGDVRGKFKWANGSTVKSVVDTNIIELLGPKTEDDFQAALVGKKKAPPATGVAAKKENKASKPAANAQVKELSVAGDDASDGAETIEELLKNKTKLHKVGENHTTEGYPILANTKELLKKNVVDVEGKVTTRFPPEPNGVLHIGHAKAININFGYAKVYGGRCYLRFDDTNPEKEEAKFFEAIEDVVHWLGYTPYKITHSSDYFDQLYLWAVELIKKDLAYVCHQTVEEMRGFNVEFSPWRSRPIEESLQLFEDMKNGKIDEGKATLRLKHILEEGKVDPVAYRIKFVPHHRTADKWCVYPTYDYTHCLCDSIENITHSLCTKEFQSRRSSYYWLCNVLDVYTPVQWEYARLNMSFTVTSKRKIHKLIENRLVYDYDDPRLFTLTGLRRRGVPAEAINKFVAKMGLTVAQTTVDPHLFDSVVRDHLNVHAPRTMAVLEPLKVTIVNFDELKVEPTIQVPDFPTDATKTASHSVNVDNVFYIERSDYKTDGEKGFRRLTKTQSVGLKYVGLVITVVEEKANDSGALTELLVKGESVSDTNKPKAFVQWVCKPVFAEVRLFEQLFKSRNPDDKAAVPGGFLTDINANTLTVLSNCAIDEYLTKSKVFDRFQFERTGFFSVDPDSDKGAELVFNRTVSLKEDAGKK